MANPPPQFSFTLSEAVGVSAMLPTYSVKLAEVTNNSPSEATSEVLNVTLQSHFVEAVKESFVPWYDKDNYINNLRLRIIVSMDEEVCKRLDYVQQRANEYISGELGPVEPASADLLPDLFLKATDSDPVLRQLMSNYGPFDALGLTQTLKETGNTEFFYHTADGYPSYMEKVFVIDVPAQNLLPVNENGLISRRSTNRVSRIQEPNGGETSLYTLDEIPATPYTFSIGTGQGIKTTNLSQFSVYAFSYFDMQNYDEAQNRRFEPSGRGVYTIFESGAGYISPSTFGGTYTEFQPQDGTVFIRNNGQIELKEGRRSGFERLPLLVGYGDSRAILSPDSSRLHNFSSYTNVAVESLNNRIFEYMNRSVDRSYIGNRKKTLLADTNYFSPLWLSKDTIEDVRYCFSFSLRSYMMNNSKYPWLYINPTSAREIFGGGNIISSNNEDGVDERTQILSTTMTKSLLNFEEFGSSNKLGSVTRKTEKDLGPLNPSTVIDTPTPLTGLILEDNDGEDVVLYEGRDILAAEKMTQQLSRIQYGISYVIKDGAETYISKYSDLLDQAQKKVTQVYDFIVNSPPALYSEDENAPGIIKNGIGLFDYDTLTRSVPLERIAIRNNVTLEFELVSNIINDQINIYLGALLGFGIPMELEVLRGQLRSLASSPNTTGLQIISNSIGDLSSVLSGIVGDAKKRFINDGGQTEKSAIERRGSYQQKTVIFQVDHKFETFATSGLTFGTGYEYIQEPVMNTEMPGLVRISPVEYSKRAIEEFNKYFYIPQGNEGTLSDAAFAAGYRNPTTSFFTPQVINTYGKPKIVQTDYRNNTGINNRYDIDRYGELFSDLIRIKKKSTFLNGSYYMLADTLASDPPNQQLFNTTLQSLIGDYYCDITFDSLLEVPDLAPSSDVSREYVPLDFDLEQIRLLPMIYGGGTDRSPTSTSWFDQRQQNISLEYPSAEANNKNLQIQPPQRKSGYPIKAMFNITGELELNSTYRDLPQSINLQFNSMKNLANELGLTENNIKTYIESQDNSGIPNQIKSMFVAAVSRDDLDLGSGFEAVRNLVQEIDLPTEHKTSVSTLALIPDLPYNETYDPMKVYSKMLAYWMNYKQLCVVEYLSGFEKTSPDLMQDQSPDALSTEAMAGFNIIATNPYTGRPKLPIWKPLTPDLLLKPDGRNRICRIRAIMPSDLSSGLSGDTTSSSKETLFNPEILPPYEDLFNLPIYNQYFILGESLGTSESVTPPPTTDPTLGGLVGTSDEPPAQQPDSTLGGLIGGY